MGLCEVAHKLEPDRFSTNKQTDRQTDRQSEYNYRASLLLQGSKGRAGGLLHSLVAVQDPLQQFAHQGLEELLMWLLNHPVGIPVKHNLEEDNILKGVSG